MHEIFENPVLEHVLNFKWHLYGKIIFMIDSLLFHIYMILFFMFCLEIRLFSDKDEELQIIINLWAFINLI